MSLSDYDAKNPSVLPSRGFHIEMVTGQNVSKKIIEYIEQNVPGKRKKDRVGA